MNSCISIYHMISLLFSGLRHVIKVADHTWLLACNVMMPSVTKRIYDGVEVQTRKSQASFQIIRLMRGYETNNLKTSLRFPCQGLNTIIFFFSHTSCFSLFLQPEMHSSHFFVFAQEYKTAIC